MSDDRIKVEFDLDSEELMSLYAALDNHALSQPYWSYLSKVTLAQRDQVSAALHELRSRPCQIPSIPNPPSS